MTHEEYYRQYRSVSMGHPAATGDFADYEESSETQSIKEHNRTMSIADQTAMEMPRYACHKEVWALKISAIVLDSDLAQRDGNRETDGSALLYPNEPGYAPVKVTHQYMRKHQPKIGGYFVVYKDGYQSFSPKEAFEEGYTRV